jgi:hypothetical protein
MPQIISKTTGYFADDRTTYTEAFVKSEYQLTTTYTIVIGGPTTPTATILKQGEIGRQASGVSAPRLGWTYAKMQYPMAILLFLVALAMALL